MDDTCDVTISGDEVDFAFIRPKLCFNDTIPAHSMVHPAIQRPWAYLKSETP